ncbi:MAG: hypothetical protein U0414_17520 [Polyangiaceae bacterium]
MSCLFAVAACKSKPQPNADAGPPLEGNANARELMTKIGQGKAPTQKNKDVHLPGTGLQWTTVIPQDGQRGFFGGVGPTEASVLRTEDAGKSWTTYLVDIDASQIVSFAGGADNSFVIALAKRQPPKKTPAKGEIPPIDTLQLYFQDGDKLAAISNILPLKDKPNLVIPKGTAQQAVLSKPGDSANALLTSFVVETGNKAWQLMYGVPATAGIPAPVPIPSGETPVFAPYGRPPVLLTLTSKELVARPWPMPNEALAKPTPITGIEVTKELQDELAKGPECEYRGWSFRRFAQPKGRVFALAVSKDKQVAFELPTTTVMTQPMGCDEEKVIVEATDPVSPGPALVICGITSGCVVPQNHAFAPPWKDQHDRLMGFAMTTKGAIAVETMWNPVQWTFLLTDSLNGGKTFDQEREVLQGKGARGRMVLGALMGFGDRTVILSIAPVTGTSANQWYALASDNNGESWGPP